MRTFPVLLVRKTLIYLCVRGLVAPRPGQIQVDPGVILMGYKGDPVLDDPRGLIKRPAWTKDGTVMVYKKLEQSVVTFEDYIAKTGPRWREFIPGGRTDIFPPLTNQEGAELFGARMVGRWKSVRFCTAVFSNGRPH